MNVVMAIIVSSAIAQQGTLVGFIGDQGGNSNADAVLELMFDEGVDLVLHAGDFDYGDSPNAWRNQVEAVFGPCPPYIAVAGNHDTSAWNGYQNVIEDWLDCNGVNYTGEAGVQHSLQWGPLFVVGVTPGVFSGNHADFIRDELAANDSIWSVTDWHKVQRDMQIGGKFNETGWAVYEEARIGGAIVATAHEHSYERTNLLSDMSEQTVVGTDLVISEGETFAFVSGLGGHSIRDQDLCFPSSFPYGCNGTWASIYTSDQNAGYGALFIEFGFGGDPCLAYGYFKDINGNVIDDFFITSTLGGCADVGDDQPTLGKNQGTSCPWDCEPTPNGNVGINDFLELLAQWTLVGSSCDFDGNGVGINAFLDLLANWGPCP